MDIAWLTDIHIDRLKEPEVFWQAVLDLNHSAYVITGDISDGLETDAMLEILGRSGRPVYFVLGNHDCYGRSVSEARVAASTPPGSCIYLTTSPVQRLSKTVALTGVDGWYDCRNGSVKTSQVILRDVQEISELQKTIDPMVAFCIATGAFIPPFVFQSSRDAWSKVCRRITDADAVMVEAKVAEACSLEGVRAVYVATHVPPFPKAAWHQGKNSDAHHLPYFSNLAVGKAILRGSAKFRAEGGQVIVLCGHTHSAGEIRPAANIRCITGGSDADQFRPGIAGVIQIDDDGAQG